MTASKAFFFAKKKQKTFGPCRRVLKQPPTGSKSFLVLFFKKELLAFLLLAGSAHAQTPVEARDPGIYAVSGAHDATDPAASSGQRLDGGTRRLLQRTTHICARLHTSFGVRFVLSADFGNDTLPVDVVIAHPAMTNQAGAVQYADHMAGTLRAGQEQFFGWTFEDPARLLPGRWHVILNHGGVALLDQPFDIDSTCGVPIS